MAPYEVKVTVASLEEASALLKRLGEAGYADVSMAHAGATGNEELDNLNAAANRLNDWILAALYRKKALNKESSTTVEGMVDGLKEMPETAAMFSARGDGIVSRTASMVASSVLGEKYGWVDFEKTSPRRFWLTPKGVAQARLLWGDAD